MNLPKALSIILAAVVIFNFLGLVFRVIKPAAFWLVTIVAAITAYWLLPRMRGNVNGKHNVEKSK